MVTRDCRERIVGDADPEKDSAVGRQRNQRLILHPQPNLICFDCGVQARQLAGQDADSVPASGLGPNWISTTPCRPKLRKEAMDLRSDRGIQPGNRLMNFLDSPANFVFQAP